MPAKASTGRLESFRRGHWDSAGAREKRARAEGAQVLRMQQRRATSGAALAPGMDRRLVPRERHRLRPQSPTAPHPQIAGDGGVFVCEGEPFARRGAGEGGAVPPALGS